MTAGLLAAAANGIGMIGVAPNVKIAAIKAATDAGYFPPEGVVCSFMWAATHGVDVANNSYWADPYYFNCRNEPKQRAIWTAERRAIRYAMQHGVVVAAAGNQRDDLAHPTRDVLSPDYPPAAAEEREVSNACAVVPIEVPGVIGVSSVGSLMRKARDSSYGTKVIDITAPQSTGAAQRSPAAPNGLFISTAAPTTACPVATVHDPITGAKYCYFGVTSAATPDVSGVAALVRSRFPFLPAAAVAARIERAADPIACPDETTLGLYAPFPQLSNGEPQTCSGGAAFNSWYGHGQVNALRALTEP
jgi:subtilisin family serine protease